MGLSPVVPRRLSLREEAVLRKILSRDFVGAVEFRAQVAFVRVVATWGVGSPSVDLAVSVGVRAADVADGLLPVEGEVRDEAGGFVGEILVWVTEGYLSAIEFTWVTDERPKVLPDPGAMRLKS
ncbi:hypothetical protein ACFVUS_38680 [Nocardia sp. NPDC058058]|uniref:hypothetical protein n=1 Tax=Nocardia sp. NPDC058058 TaxID=3346317 RepID=UPI0036D83978